MNWIENNVMAKFTVSSCHLQRSAESSWLHPQALSEFTTLYSPMRWGVDFHGGVEQLFLKCFLTLSVAKLGYPTSSK